ncbi:MAG: hypothetical protein WC546_00425 [Candidatus Omnitrophota bacterium]
MSNFNIDWQVFERKFLVYFHQLLRFDFSVTNPVFWLFLLVILFILTKLWKTKKALSFCFVVALILLSATKIENYIAPLIIKNGGSFDPLLIRIGCLFIILIVLLYYSFIRENTE